MFCKRCGARIDDGASFCEKCGTSIDATARIYTTQQPSTVQPAIDITQAMPSVQTGQQTWIQSEAPYVQSQGEKKQGANKVILAIFIVIIIALLAFIAVMGFSMYQSSKNLEVHYGSDSCIYVTSDSIIIPYGDDGEELSQYKVMFYVVDAADDIDWENASIDVSNINGFRLQSMPEGIYSIEIIDVASGDTSYVCPQFKLVENDVEDTASHILLTVDSHNPKSAHSGEVEYGWQALPYDVEFTFSNSSGTSNASETWSYVQLSDASVSGSQNFNASEAIEKLNAAIKQDFDDSLQTAKDWSSQTGLKQCVILRESVTYLSDEIVCIRKESYLTDWAGGSDVEVSGLTYSVQTGSPVNVLDYNSLYGVAAEESCKEALAVYASEVPDELDENAINVLASTLVADSSRFYMAGESLIACVFQSDLSEGASGTREIVIRYSESDEMVGVDVQSIYTEIEWQ